MDGGRLRRPHLLGIYFMSKMHTKTIQKIQKAYIKTYEKDVKIYKDIENSQGTLLLQKCRPLYGTARGPGENPQGHREGSPSVLDGIGSLGRLYDCQG